METRLHQSGDHLLSPVSREVRAQVLMVTLRPVVPFLLAQGSQTVGADMCGPAEWKEGATNLVAPRFRV